MLLNNKMIKDKPILMNGEMVTATIEEIKNQTRRPIKNCIGDGTKENPLRMDLIKCEFGCVGDLLWVRENTECVTSGDGTDLSNYCADKKPVLYSNCDDAEYNGSWAHWDYLRAVRPSIHMERWASRITLEITDIKAERIQDISEEDALSEGLKIFNEDDANLYYTGISTIEMWPSEDWVLDNPIEAFKNLWDSIYAGTAFKWDKNPYVWVVKFKRHMVNIDNFKEGLI